MGTALIRVSARFFWDVMGSLGQVSTIQCGMVDVPMCTVKELQVSYRHHNYQLQNKMLSRFSCAS